MVGVAQLVEHRVVAPVVAGSSPVTHPIKKVGKPRVFGFLAFYCGLENLAVWASGSASSP